MATAYQLYQAGRYPEVEVLCRGLVAADHKYWWSYSLYAATLRRLGRLREAVEQVEKGLVYEPDEPKLLLMRSELRAEISRDERRRGDATTTTIHTPLRKGERHGNLDSSETRWTRSITKMLDPGNLVKQARQQRAAEEHGTSSATSRARSST